jgi:hypothetical protein
MFAADPDDRARVRSDAACSHWGAGAPSCRSVRWLRGRTCCETCQTRDGDHDGGTTHAA